MFLEIIFSSLFFTFTRRYSEIYNIDLFLDRKRINIISLHLIVFNLWISFWFFKFTFFFFFFPKYFWKRKWESTISKCSIIIYIIKLNTCFSPFFFPNNLIPISKTREKEMLCICDTDGEQSHYCSTIDTFSLFFQTNFENAKRKRKSMESIERSHYCSTIDAYFSRVFFFFFLNLIFISITWHWYQKKKKKKNAWHSRYGILIFVIIRSNGANTAFHGRYFQMALLRSFCPTVTRN